MLKVGVLIGAMVLGSMPVHSAQAAAGNYPSKPVSFIVHSAAGGGTDFTARLIARIFEQEKIVPQPLVVENKTGGSGAVAIKYMSQKAGDPYTLWNAGTTVILTQPRRAGLPLTFRDFTPIALIARDPGVIAVRADSPYKTTAELIAAAKAKPKSVKAGLSIIGGSGHVITGILTKKTGAEFAQVSFSSGGEAATALLGGHVDFIAENTNEVLPLLEAGKVRLIGTTGSARLPGYPDVARLQEQGIDVTFETARFIFGPKDIPSDVVAYWEKATRKLVETQAWKEELNKNQMLPAYVIGKDFRAYLEAEEKPLIDTLIELKVITN